MRLSKPYWCDELTDLWRKYHEKEKAFLRFKGPGRHKSKLRLEYKVAQQTFDKRKRQIEREHHKNKLIDIQKVCTDNPREFWNHIKRLGPNKKKIDIPVFDNGAIQTDPKIVLE